MSGIWTVLAIMVALAAIGCGEVSGGGATPPAQPTNTVLRQSEADLLQRIEILEAEIKRLDAHLASLGPPRRDASQCYRTSNPAIKRGCYVDLYSDVRPQNWWGFPSSERMFGLLVDEYALRQFREKYARNQP